MLRKVQGSRVPTSSVAGSGNEGKQEARKAGKEQNIIPAFLASCFPAQKSVSNRTQRPHQLLGDQRAGRASPVQIENKQIIIDGKPQIIMSGEVHYFRLPPEVWQDRLDKLKAAGCNTVASYVPWLCHETIEGDFDFTGRTRPELDLAGFIDLCRKNDLHFFVRPGPFAMAELKNEGLPYWVYEKHPEIIPHGWDNKAATTKTVDYLAPGFLDAARKWYGAVMEVIAPRLHSKGGNIIAIQLDNEIGMLSWVSNTPDLTDHVLGDFASWLKRTYDAPALKARYPFDLDDVEVRNPALRSPGEAYAARLMADLGHYMRNRFARYVDQLREFSEDAGVNGTPFVVNVHGTGGGRGFTFPIGISQLYESYTQAPGYVSGSDIYLGTPTPETFQDLYIVNAFMDAVHDKDQPLTSVEFESGDGNYGNSVGPRYDPSAVDFKLRMCVAQGNRLINHYLFTGGYNYQLDPAPKDGNGRIAFTGERHGFAAPVSPEGKLNYTYPRMSRANQAVMAVADKLAEMNEQHDGVSLAFIPDYFMTEYRYPGSASVKEIAGNLEANRAAASWESMGRAMLLCNYRFGALDIQNRPLDAKQTPVLALGCARYLQPAVQQKLADYLASGGNLLLVGELPTHDLEGEPCTILADALGAKTVGVRRGADDFYLSVAVDGWAAPRAEERAHFAQIFEGAAIDPIMRVAGSGEVCGFEAACGEGRAIVVGAAFPCDLPFYRTALERLGAVARLQHDCAEHGLFLTSTANPGGERFVHVLNLDGFDKELRLSDHGSKLFAGRKLTLSAKEGVMLPLGVHYHGVEIAHSTAEIARVKKSSIEFRLTQPKDVIALKTKRQILPSKDFSVSQRGGTTIVTSLKHAKVDDRLVVRFR